MNPGTILFIVLGIIGLLLYTLRALELKEHFISNQKELMNIHPKIGSIFSAIGTPDFDTGNIMFKNNLSATTSTALPPLNQESKPSAPPTSLSAPPTSLSAPPTIPTAPPTSLSAPPTSLSPPPSAPSAIPSLKPGSPKLSYDEINRPNNKDELTISDIQGSIINNSEKSRKKKRVKKCPPMPDMSLYIRKDQIPCWNCVIP